MVSAQNRAARLGQMLPWAITLPSLQARHAPIVGQLTVSSITWGAARTGSIGYWVDMHHAGSGIAPEAVAMAVDHCFTAMGLHRIEINIRPENGPSLRVVQKLGFRDEGVRKDFLHINGAWADHRSFALTHDEVPGGNAQPVAGPNPVARRTGCGTQCPAHGMQPASGGPQSETNGTQKERFMTLSRVLPDTPRPMRHRTTPDA